MAILDTGRAIQSVSELLRDQINTRLGRIFGEGNGIVDMVRIGRPQPPAGNITEEFKKKINIFLYEAKFDPTLRNTALAEGEQPPLWLVLKYIMTAFDDNGFTDTVEAHGYLGEGIRAFQELAYLPLTQSSAIALGDNPQALKITFDEVSSDLLSKLMQGPDEIYRFSMAFQVRPVMIRTQEIPSHSLLVGVDYTSTPASPIEESPHGVEIDVIPTLGHEITKLNPVMAEPGDILEIRGNALDQSDLTVQYGPVELAATFQQPDKLRCTIDGIIPNGEVISAGSHPVSVYRTLPDGRRRSSNLLIGNLLPILDEADSGGLVYSQPGDTDSPIEGFIDITGTLLGTAKDYVIASLYKEGEVIQALDKFRDEDIDPPPAFPQTKRRLIIVKKDGVPSGSYRLIYRVDGQQAKNSPIVELIP